MAKVEHKQYEIPEVSVHTKIYNITNNTSEVILPLSINDILEKCEARDPNHGAIYHIVKAPIPEFYKIKYMDDILKFEIDKCVKGQTHSLKEAIDAFIHVVGDQEYKFNRLLVNVEEDFVIPEEYIISEKTLTENYSLLDKKIGPRIQEDLEQSVLC